MDPHAVHQTRNSPAELAVAQANILTALAALDQQLATLRRGQSVQDRQLAEQLASLRAQIANQNRAIGALALRLDDQLAQLRELRQVLGDLALAEKLAQLPAPLVMVRGS